MSFAVPVPLLFLQLRFIHRIDPQSGKLPANFDDPAGTRSHLGEEVRLD
jgi:hypothetical protein